MRQLSVAIQSPSAAIRVAALNVWKRYAIAPDPAVVASIAHRVDAVRLMAYQVVLVRASPDLVMYVRRGIRDKNVEIQRFVLTTIAESALQIPAEVLHYCLTDADQFVSFHAAEILAKCHDQVAIEWLLEQYQSPKIFVKKNAIRVLGTARVPCAVPLLLHELATRSDYLIPAIYALGDIAHPDALRPLLAQICSSVVAVSKAAVTALIAYQHPLVVVAMRQALFDTRSSVRYNATAILAGYHVIPDIHDSALFFHHADPQYCSQLLNAFLQGDGATIIAALTTLHDLAVFCHDDRYYKMIRNIIRNHPEFDEMVQTFLTASVPFFVHLGLVCLECMNVTEMVVRQVLTLSSDPTSSVSGAVQKYLHTLANRSPQLLVPYWDQLPLAAKEHCIRYVLAHPDHAIRSYALYDADVNIRMRCIRFFCARNSVSRHAVFAQLSAREVAHIVSWQSDETIHNRLLITDIVATWQQAIDALPS
jgi:HEAT repeat protein